MNELDFLRAKFHEVRAEPAVIWGEQAVSYAELSASIARAGVQLDEQEVRPGTVMLLAASFSPAAIALLLAALDRAAIVALVDGDEAQTIESKAAIAGADVIATIDDAGLAEFRPGPSAPAVPQHYATLRRRGHPGLVLFSSGTAGAIKAAVHDVTPLLQKYRRPRHKLRTLAFLRFSHIGGIDTLLYNLANGSCLVVADDRTPEAVCALIARHRVEVLPAAPSFLNLIALSGAWRHHDLSSLRFVTYGAEVMPQATLDRCGQMFPGAQLLQKYGTTEVGTLRSQSKAPGSLWMRLGGEGYDVRVVDGRLQIKAESAMLGYLNAPSPIDADGWFHTGDLVEVDGDFVRIKGRETDVINVGGRKVHPAEVESALLQVDNVADVTVYGEPNALLGQIVCARVQPARSEDAEAFRRRIRQECGQHLDSYKVPAKIVIAAEPSMTARFKKVRHGA